MDQSKEILKNVIAGEHNAELYYEQRREMRIKAFRGEIADFSFSADKFMSARVIEGGKLGTSFTEKALPGLVWVKKVI